VYARPPKLATARVISANRSQTAVFDGMADHVALFTTAMLHSINEGEGGFAFRQIVPQVLAQTGFIGLIVERIVHQLKGRPDVASIAGKASSISGVASLNTAAICAPASNSRAVLRPMTSM